MFLHKTDVLCSICLDKNFIIESFWALFTYLGAITIAPILPLVFAFVPRCESRSTLVHCRPVWSQLVLGNHHHVLQHFLAENRDTVYIVSQKVALLKLFAIFSLLVNLCNWKFSWLLPNHILNVYQFWSIYLNIYVNCVTFSSKTPQILRF